MTDTSLDELGPVDYVVVEFPAGASNFTGEMVKELLALVNAGTIRVIDILILTKDDDGAVELTAIETPEFMARDSIKARLVPRGTTVERAAALR